MYNLVITKEKAQKGQLYPGSTKINLKNLKTYLWLDDLMQATVLRHQLYSDARFEALEDSGQSNT